jgi:lipoprotein-anchoring transpeptidase ErfK/SrfK
MRFRAGYTGFRTFFAILSMTLLLAYGALLVYGAAAKAEPEAPNATPEASQAAPEPNPSVGAGQTEAEGAATESGPADAQTEADPSAAETPPEDAESGTHATTSEDAEAGTDATPPEDAAAGSDVTPPEDAAAGTEEKPSEDAAAGTEAVPEEPASNVLVTVDKGTQHMTVFVDGIEQYSWPVSTGMAGYSTPSGEYTTSSMNEIWYSKQWDNAPMPNAIFFTKKGHAIHGSLDVKHLGKPASHGCVRISPANAKTLYALVKEKGLKNTQVVLTGVTPGGEYKVADQPRGYDTRYGDVPPWFQPGQGYYQPRRRGLFGFGGRRWSPPSYGPQGYYRPRGYPPGY